MNSQSIGRIGELLVNLKFLEQGYSVYRPEQENSTYDLIVEKDNKIYRVEVKTTTQESKNKKNWVVGLRGIRPNRTGNNIKKFNRNNIDILAICVLPTKEVYLLDTKELQTKSQLQIRKTNQSGC